MVNYKRERLPITTKAQAVKKDPAHKDINKKKTCHKAQLLIIF